jgi:hypothetical protein
MLRQIRSAVGLTLASVLASSAAATTLSGNLIQGGDFEDTAYLKNVGSLDSEDLYIPLHRFNEDADLGLWLGVWGPPSISEGTIAGFSTYDNPRTDAPGNTQVDGDLGNLNRSADPFRPDNYVMETVMISPRTAQWNEAPADHVARPISFSFDF